MQSYVNVRPEHLNHHGYLFGGQMLKWVDEYSWMAASLDYPECTWVTIGMNKVVFKQRVTSGAILRLEISVIKKGITSITYCVSVFQSNNTNNVAVFDTEITFVNVDSCGRKKAIQ